MLSIFFKLQTLRLEFGSAIYFADIQNPELSSDFPEKYKILNVSIFFLPKTEQGDEVLDGK